MAYARKRAYRKKRMPMHKRRKVPYKVGIKKKVSIVRSANLKKDIHYFSRWVSAVDVTTLSTITSSISHGFVFRLSDVMNSTDYTNLFEQFRIVGVQLTFRLMDNPDSSSYVNQPLLPQGANFYPKLWWVYDQDDGTAPTLLQIRERGEAKCAVLKPDRFIKLYVKYPKPQIATFGNTTSGYTTMKSLWLRTWTTSEIDTPHYGLKVVLDKMGYAGNTFTVGIERKYIFAFKQSK